MRAMYSAFFAVLVAICIGKANTLECYVCRGCAEVTSAQIQTCNSSITTDAPEITTSEPVTDQDTIFDEPTDIKQIKNLPLIDADETESRPNGFVLDKSELPGAKFLSRGLKQFKDEESDARCVIAVFNEPNGSPNVVRGCSTASSDDKVRCREAVGGNYNGDFHFCKLCDEDLCNSGAAKSALAIVILVAGILLNMSMN